MVNVQNPNFGALHSFKASNNIPQRFFCPGSCTGDEEVSVDKGGVDPLSCTPEDSMFDRSEFKLGNIETISDTVMDDPAGPSGSVFKTFADLSLQSRAGELPSLPRLEHGFLSFFRH